MVASPPAGATALLTKRQCQCGHAQYALPAADIDCAQCGEPVPEQVDSDQDRGDEA